MNVIRQLCTSEPGTSHVLQGNIAFAVGCVRAGIHAVDGYPGTPSTEVLDKGLSHVKDMIDANWSVNEAVAAGVGHGHSLAGRDCVVTMKIPGLFQAGDIVTSASCFTQPRGGLIYYLASDFTPSSTQHVIDPRYLFKSCFVPVFEPRNHQEMHEAAAIAVDIARRFNTCVVILASGVLCHSEGLMSLMEQQTREPVDMGDLRAFNCLPVMARNNYDTIQEVRVPGLNAMVEDSPLNRWTRGAGKRGVITHGVNDLYVQEYRALFEPDLDVLSLGFTHPLPMGQISRFCQGIEGEVYVVEDGYRFIQESCLQHGLKVTGKAPGSKCTEYTPESVAQLLGKKIDMVTVSASPVPRPPMICAGCPYALFANVAAKLKKRGALEAIFGDIGCNALLYFFNAMDTGVGMGGSESKRTGYVSSKPESAGKCISVIGDSTECHSGMDATRNAVYRNTPGVKVVLDNEWTAMTGGQNSPASPVNYHGDPNKFDLAAAIKGEGAEVVCVDAYDLAAVRGSLKQALKDAEQGIFTVIVIRGTCIRRVPKTALAQKMVVDADKCKECGICNFCPGIEYDENHHPVWNNLCSGCASNTPACMQICPAGAIRIATAEEAAKASSTAPAPSGKARPAAPDTIDVPAVDTAALPDRLSLAIRGVGGQGNLFFGKVLARMAFLAGYGKTNVVKGETHGMAQMGGPVISTFACGRVHSPQILPGTADALIVMEKSEVLRPGFISMLKSGGTVLMAQTAVVPQGLAPADYPEDTVINEALQGFEVIRMDVLKMAMDLGDSTGRTANVVMLGALSALSPFNTIPGAVWLSALKTVSPTPGVWHSNYAAFSAGINLIPV